MVTEVNASAGMEVGFPWSLEELEFQFKRKVYMGEMENHVLRPLGSTGAVGSESRRLRTLLSLNRRLFCL